MSEPTANSPDDAGADPAKDAESAQGELWSEPDVDTAETASGLWKGLRRHWRRSETRSPGASRHTRDGTDAGGDSANTAASSASAREPAIEALHEVEPHTAAEATLAREHVEAADDAAAPGDPGSGIEPETQSGTRSDTVGESDNAEDEEYEWTAADLAAGGWSTDDLRGAGWTDEQLIAVGWDPEAEEHDKGKPAPDGLEAEIDTSATTRDSEQSTGSTDEEPGEILQAPEPDAQAATPHSESRETRADPSQASTNGLEAATAAGDFEFVFDEDPIELETYDIEAPLALRPPTASPDPTPVTPQITPQSTPPVTSPGSSAATAPAAGTTTRPAPPESTTNGFTPADGEDRDDEPDRAAEPWAPADAITDAGPEQSFWTSLIDDDPAAEQMSRSSPGPLQHHFPEDQALPEAAEAPTVAADDSSAPAYVEYRPSNTRRWILGGLFLAAAVLAVVAVFYAVQQGTSSSVITAVSVIVLACALWWGLISWAPRIITISNGTLEVAQGPNSEHFDLTSPRTEIELGEDPRARSWTAEVVRPNGSRLVIRSNQVRPQQFTELVNRYRPAGATPPPR